MGSTDPAVRNLTAIRAHLSHLAGGAEPNLMPEVKLQEEGIAAYYGDTVLIFDTLTNKYSRAGVLPYGLVTSHCAYNGSHIACALGEPRHLWNSNTESVVQIAQVKWAVEA